MEKKNPYIVKRYLIETFEVMATSRENALEEVTIEGDPSSIEILKETVRKTKQ